MPIATCYIQETLIKKVDFKKLVSDWASSINVSKADITLNLITNHLQFGHCYKVLVTLFLPSVWSQEQIEEIQRSLSIILEKHLNISPSDVFLMTDIISSGHVFTDGAIQKWEERN